MFGFNKPKAEEAEAGDKKLPKHVRKYIKLERDLDKAKANARIRGKDLETDERVVKAGDALDALFFHSEKRHQKEITKYLNAKRVRMRIEEERNIVERKCARVLNKGAGKIRGSAEPIGEIMEETGKTISSSVYGLGRGLRRGVTDTYRQAL